MTERGEQTNDEYILSERVKNQIKINLEKNPDKVSPELEELYKRQSAGGVKPEEVVPEAVSESTQKEGEALPGFRESLKSATSNSEARTEAANIVREAASGGKASDESLTEEEELKLSRFKIKNNSKNQPPTDEEVARFKKNLIEARGSKTGIDIVEETPGEQTSPENPDEVDEIIEGEFEDVENERTRDEILDDIQLISEKIPRNETVEEKKVRTQKIREARERLRKESVDPDLFLKEGLNLQNEDDRKEFGKRKAILRNLVSAAKNGEIGSEQNEILEKIGLSGDRLGVNVVDEDEEQDPIVNQQQRRPRMIPVEDEDMPSYGEKAPRTEVELKLKFREVIRDYLRDTQDENSLGVDRIKTKIKYTFGGVEFDRLCKDVSGGNDEVKRRIESEVNAEIEARANLRRAQLREMEYVSMTDKGKAIERFISDNQEGSGGRKSALIALTTYKWLQSLGNGEVSANGDKLSALNIDRAFAVMIMMGEGQPGFTTEWMKEFDVFRPYVVNGGERKYITNLYWPSYFSEKRDNYPQEYVEKVKRMFPGMEFADISADMMLEAFYNKLNDKFGEDSSVLAKQLFDGYKERGNYDWQHYMAGLFTFSSSRDAVAMNVTPPGYTGSSRPYDEKFNVSGEWLSISDVKKLNYDGMMSDDEAKDIIKEIKSRQVGDGVEFPLTYDKQIQRLAISPLRVKKPENPSQTPYSPEVVNEPRLLLRRAKEGKLIRETKWDDRGFYMKYLPQLDSLNTIKLGLKVRAAIDSIGLLSEASDKSTKVGEAVAALVTLREKGDSLVDYGALTASEVDSQILIEAANVLWELGVNNERNVQDLEIQSISKPNFITPALINALYARLGGSTTTGLKIMGKTGANYARLNNYTKVLRKRTIDLMNRMAIVDTTGESGKVLTAQEREMQKDLPTEYGVGVKTRTQREMERDAETINGVYDVLEKVFPWMRKK